MTNPEDRGRISPRVAKLMVGFIFLTVVGVYALPRLFHKSTALADIPHQHFSVPLATPTPMAHVVMQKAAQVLHLPPPPEAKKKDKPVCQPCIQAANEVLMRYMKAIRDGAGSDDSLEHYGNLAVSPQVYPLGHSVYNPYGGSDGSLPIQHQRQFGAAGNLPSAGIESAQSR